MRIGVTDGDYNYLDKTEASLYWIIFLISNHGTNFVVWVNWENLVCMQSDVIVFTKSVITFS